MQRLLGRVHTLTRDWWDPSRRLVTHPGGYLGGRHVGRAEVGLLAPTVWWALGLLRRGDPGDRELAEVAVRGVLARQCDAPGTARHGAWPTTDPASLPQSAPGVPGDSAVQGRIVVATALALLVRDHELPAQLEHDVRAAVERAVRGGAAGELGTGPTELAVQLAWLELEVGRWRSDEELLAIGAERAQSVAADSGTRGHVAQHIGPTTTGSTLVGLSLWAARPPVPDLAPLGRALRDEVWHDLLAVWHPGLLTLVPPFTRADGMDLREHVGATALWITWLVDGIWPLPPLDGTELHQAQELPLVFLVDALAAASQDVLALAPLVRAQPARQGEWFDRVGERVWTGWTGGDLAVGAEWSGERQVDPRQAVTAAAIWRAEDRNAWLRLLQDGAVEARVEHRDGVVRLTHGTRAAPVSLLVGGGQPEQVTPTSLVHGGRTWRLEGVRELQERHGDLPPAARAWEVVPDADGIVLATDV